MDEAPARSWSALCFIDLVGEGSCKRATVSGAIFYRADTWCLGGSTWEAAMFGAHHALNVIAIVDKNDLIIGGTVAEISDAKPPVEKWQSFGWHAAYCDGNSAEQLEHYLPIWDGPTAIVARTIKGKGVSFMEGRREWHHGTMSAEQYAQAMGELDGNA